MTPAKTVVQWSPPSGNTIQNADYLPSRWLHESHAMSLVPFHSMDLTLDTMFPSVNSAHFCRCRDCKHSAGPLLLCSSCDVDRHADVLIHRREKWDGSWESLKPDAAGRFCCVCYVSKSSHVLMSLIPACGLQLTSLSSQAAAAPWAALEPSAGLLSKRKAWTT